MESLWEPFALVTLLVLAGRIRFPRSRDSRATRAIQRHPLWKSVRDRHIRAHPFCAVCGRASNLAVHHKQPVSLFPNRELDSRNLVTLCQNESFNCHFVVGHLMNWSTYNPDVDRDIAFWSARLRGRLEKKSLLHFLGW